MLSPEKQITLTYKAYNIMKTIVKEILLVTPRHELIDMIQEQALLIKTQSLLRDKLQNYIDYLESQVSKLKCKLYENDPDGFQILDDLSEYKKFIPKKE